MADIQFATTLSMTLSLVSTICTRPNVDSYLNKQPTMSVFGDATELPNDNFSDPAANQTQRTLPASVWRRGSDRGRGWVCWAIRSRSKMYFSQGRSYVQRTTVRVYSVSSCVSDLFSSSIILGIVGPRLIHLLLYSIVLCSSYLLMPSFVNVKRYQIMIMSSINLRLRELLSYVLSTSWGG